MTAFTGSHEYARRLTILDGEGEPLEDATAYLLDGSIQVGAGLIRRSADMTLADPVGRYSPGPGRLVWWDHPYRVEFGARQAGSWLWEPVGTIYPDEPEHGLGEHTVLVPGRDALKLVADSEVTSVVTLTDGSPVSALVALGLAGATFLGTPRLDDGGAVLLGDHTYEIGTSWPAILEQATRDHVLDLFADPLGVPVLRPQPDPATAPVAAAWALGRGVRLLGFRKRWRQRAKNHVLVEGLTVDDKPVRVELFDRDPDSPVMFGKPGVPDLFLRYTSDGITSEEQCYRVGLSLLRAYAVEEEVEAEVVPDPTLERLDVVELEEPSSGTAGRFSLESFPLPFKPGSHRVTVRRTRDLRAA